MKKLLQTSTALVVCSKKLSRVAAVALILPSLSAQAVEVGGFELSGYTRAGAYSSPAGTPRGNYTLGGDTQKFRLGNEGDNGIEVSIGKTFETSGGMKWGAVYMPAIWNNRYGTAQAVATLSGFTFAPEAKFWVGQPRLRIQDVHIVDRFIMDYGDNTGAGVTDFSLGFAKLGVGIFTSSTMDNSASAANNANRLNVDVSEIKLNSGGTLRVLATLVRGTFQMGRDGTGLSLSHNQSDFFINGLTNTLFLQSATGHAGLSGQFQGLGDASIGGVEQPGLQSIRVVDTINWQRGVWGGQAMVAYQTAQIDGGVKHGQNTRDFSLGGRVSYAIGQNFKLQTELGTTTRGIDGQAQQRLNKVTIAPTLALAPEFWSRPELRFYVTHAYWNNAAAAANAGASGFGMGGRTSSTIAGVQVEAWW